MKMTKHKFILVTAMIVSSLLVPFMIQHHAQIRLSARQESVRRQTDRIAQLTAENKRSSNLIAQMNPAQSLSDEQLTELLRLRNEVGHLRAQASAIGSLQEENLQLEARLTDGLTRGTQMSSAEFDEKLTAEMIQTLKIICRELPAATQKFALDHTNQAPADFSELRKYFPTSGSHRIFGLSAFAFVRNRGPLPDDALILSEDGRRKKPDGRFARVYAFSDGRVVEVILDDPGDFQAWETEHMSSAPASNP